MSSRKNISISDSVEQKARDLIAGAVGDGLSDLIARLVREEWDRRHSTLFNDAPAKGSANQPVQPVSYLAGKRRRKARQPRPEKSQPKD